MNIDKNAVGFIDDAQLLADEAKYSSFGDTVHYVDPPKIFRHGEGSWMIESMMLIWASRLSCSAPITVTGVGASYPWIEMREPVTVTASTPAPLPPASWARATPRQATAAMAAAEPLRIALRRTSPMIAFLFLFFAAESAPHLHFIF